MLVLLLVNNMNNEMKSELTILFLFYAFIHTMCMPMVDSEVEFLSNVFWITLCIIFLMNNQTELFKPFQLLGTSKFIVIIHYR